VQVIQSMRSCERTLPVCFLPTQPSFPPQSPHHHHHHSRLFSYLRPLQLVLLDRVRHVEEVLLLLHVRTLETGSDTGARVATGVEDVSPVVVLGLVEKSLDSGLREGPWSGVEGLLLGPDDRLGVRVRVEVLLQLLPWEWVELLDTGNGSVGDLVLLTVLVQCHVGLASAHDYALNLVVGVELEVVFTIVGDIRDDPLEVALASEVFDA